MWFGGVLFSTTAGAGHFGLLVPFARACLAVGHTVALAAPASFADQVARAGVEHVPFPMFSTEVMGAVFSRVAQLPHDEADRLTSRDTQVWRFRDGTDPAQVVVPLFAFDQFVNAGRVAAVGAGVQLLGGPAATDQLRAAVEQLLQDASCRTGARAVAAEIAALPDVASSRGSGGDSRSLGAAPAHPPR